MTDPQDAEKKAPRGGKRRAAIYGERKTITLRMGQELNARLMDFCNTQHLPANMHVNTLIATALTKADPASMALKRVEHRGEARIILTLRLDPELHDRLSMFCSGSAISVNAFVCGLVQKDLRQRGL